MRRVHSAVGGSCVAAVPDLRCALLCRSLAWDYCKKLEYVLVNMDIDTSEKVLSGLNVAQEIINNNGLTRKLHLYLPGR